MRGQIQMIVEIRMLGGLNVSAAGRESARFRTQKTAGLLAYLARHRGNPFSREHLADAFWPDSDFDDARHNLRVALSSIRKLLSELHPEAPELLQADRSIVRVDQSRCETDVARFQHALAAADRAPGDALRIKWLEQAAEIYRGPFLPELAEEWVWTDRQRLADLFLRCLLDLVAALARTGHLEEAISYAGRAVAEDPSHEPAHLELMKLYDRAGAPARSLKQFELLERSLAPLDLQPSAEARKLLAELSRRAAERDSAPPHGLDDSPSFAHGVATCVALSGLSARDAAAIARGLAGQVREGPEGLILAYFGRPSDAVRFALAARDASKIAGEAQVGAGLDTTEWSEGEGRPEEAPSLAWELARLAHPGQLLLSERTRMLLPERVATETGCRDLGAYRLSGSEAPVQIFQADGADPADFPRLSARPLALGHVPIALTRFYGREEELERLREMLVDGHARWVTLVGMPGIGKSRLALEFARGAFDDFGGRVWHVSLAERAPPLDILRTIANAIGLPASPDPAAAIAELLRGEAALLVLDSVERSETAAIDQAERLLRTLPNLRVLCTARSPLRVDGERRVVLEPLPVEGPEGIVPAAVQLFADRAGLADPHLKLTEASLPLIYDVCRRLDGIPLAIELCAARVPAGGLEDLSERLGRALDLLKKDRPGLDGGRRSMEGALEWSFGQLSEAARHALQGLAAFEGDWSIPVASDVLALPDLERVVDELLDAAWVNRIARRVPGRPRRFGMFTLVREFLHGTTPPEMREALLRAHAEHYARLCREAEAALTGPDQSEWLLRLDDELENVKAAFRCAIDHAPELALDIVLGASRYWLARSLQREGLAMTRQALATGSGAPELRLRAMRLEGVLAWMQGHREEAERVFSKVYEQALSAGDRKAAAEAVYSTGNAALQSADLDRARACYRRALELNGEDARVRAICLHNLGLVSVRQGRLTEATEELRQAKEALEAQGDLLGVGTCLSALGDLYTAMNRPDDAQSMYEEALAVATKLGDELSTGDLLTTLGRLHAERDELPEATRLLAEAYEHHLAADRVLPRADTLVEQARVQLRLGELDTAATKLRDALILLPESGDAPETAGALLMAADLALGRGDPTRAARLFRASKAAAFAAGAVPSPADQQRLNRTEGKLAALDLDSGTTPDAPDTALRLAFEVAGV
jgi:DNA-binding SARP family transcriptional activator/predicted ATPase